MSKVKVDRMLIFFLMVHVECIKVCPYAFVPQRIWGKGLTVCCRYARCLEGFYLKKCTIDMGADVCVKCPRCTYQDKVHDSYYPKTCKQRRCFSWEISTTVTSTSTKLNKLSTPGLMSTTSILLNITNNSIATTNQETRERRFTTVQRFDSKTLLPKSTDSYPYLSTSDYLLDIDSKLSTHNKRLIGWYTTGRKRRRFSETPSTTPTSTGQSAENSGNNYFIEVCTFECKLSRYILIGLGILVVILIGITGFLVYLHKKKRRPDMLNVTSRQNSESGRSDAYQDISGYILNDTSLPNSPTHCGRVSYLHPYLTINRNPLQDCSHVYETLQTRF